MARPGVWGGELELTILSNLKSVKFQIYLFDGKIMEIDNTKDDLKEDKIRYIKLSYHNRSHYNCLKPDNKKQIKTL